MILNEFRERIINHVLVYRMTEERRTVSGTDFKIRLLVAIIARRKISAVHKSIAVLYINTVMHIRELDFTERPNECM